MDSTPLYQIQPNTLPSKLDQRADDILRTMEQIKALRATSPNINVAEILVARHEGHRY